MTRDTGRYQFLTTATCRFCKGPIRIFKTPQGKTMICDDDPKGPTLPGTVMGKEEGQRLVASRHYRKGGGCTERSID